MQARQLKKEGRASWMLHPRELLLRHMPVAGQSALLHGVIKETGPASVKAHPFPKLTASLKRMSLLPTCLRLSCNMRTTCLKHTQHAGK